MSSSSDSPPLGLLPSLLSPSPSFPFPHPIALTRSLVYIRRIMKAKRMKMSEDDDNKADMEFTQIHSQSNRMSMGISLFLGSDTSSRPSLSSFSTLSPLSSSHPNDNYPSPTVFTKSALADVDALFKDPTVSLSFSPPFGNHQSERNEKGIEIFVDVDEGFDLNDNTSENQVKNDKNQNIYLMNNKNTNNHNGLEIYQDHDIFNDNEIFNDNNNNNDNVIPHIYSDDEFSDPYIGQKENVRNRRKSIRRSMECENDKENRVENNNINPISNHQDNNNKNIMNNNNNILPFPSPSPFPLSSLSLSSTLSIIPPNHVLTPIMETSHESDGSCASSQSTTSAYWKKCHGGVGMGMGMVGKGRLSFSSTGMN